MGKVIYGSNMSLDGWTETADGDFAWAPPDDEVFAFITELMASTDTYLYGRRMYGTLAVWETDPALGAASEGLRAELRPHGIHVVTVYPGPVESAMEAAARKRFGNDRMSPKLVPLSYVERGINDGVVSIHSASWGRMRGCIPADHELAFSRTRGSALKGADVAIVAGVPLDFRLGFGGAIGEDAKLIRVDAEPNRLERNRAADVDLVGDVASTLGALAASEPGSGSAAWIAGLRAEETEKREAENEDRADPRGPLHPMRLYEELGQVLDRDAIVIGDGGDFVSYAGRVIETFEPGTWMDPGPFGCLGAGPGQAIGAACANPGKQICLLLGDGAFGFSGLEFDTMVRHGLPIVGVMGNNGIWALEKHPMEYLYGYSIAAELRPETPYEEVVEALGGHGELVREPEELRPALERAFASGKPALVNVLTDPDVVYPRRAVLV